MRKYFIYFLILFAVTNCRQPYLPPVIEKNYNYLVVDGYIVNGNDSTVIKLSRTTNISDSLPPVPELGAQVSVVGDQSDVYPLIDNLNGSYSKPSLTLNTAEKYKLRIVTTNGNVYESAFVNVKSSPPIDSVSWDQLTPGNVNLYVSTHDPSNNTRYYRWDYTETWAYQAKFASIMEYGSSGLILRPPADYIYLCYRSRNSPDILINSSKKLVNDVIDKSHLLQITEPDERLHVKYSILVTQYAIDQNAFAYYQQLQNNSQNLGSIFSTTPSVLIGNIKNVKNASEIVIGYIGAGSVSKQRIFIDYLQIRPWPNPPAWDNCLLHVIPFRDTSFYLNHTNLVPIDWQYNALGFPIALYESDVDCGDCRFEGGTTTKPSFWP